MFCSAQTPVYRTRDTREVQMIDYVMSAKAAVKNAVSISLGSISANALRPKQWALMALLTLTAASASASITLSKTFVPGTWNGVGAPPSPLLAPVNQGDDAWLRITVTNSSANPVTALQGTDNFLPGAAGLVIAPEIGRAHV